MCFSPTMNNTQSFGSIVLKMIVTWVKQNTECLFLYTLADGIMGKCGYVYQASNFTYLGNSKQASITIHRLVKRYIREVQKNYVKKTQDLKTRKKFFG